MAAKGLALSWTQTFSSLGNSLVVMWNKNAGNTEYAGPLLDLERNTVYLLAYSFDTL